MNHRKMVLVAGVLALVVLIGLALSWKRIYFTIYPEARLWGRWLSSPGFREDDPTLQLTLLEFSRDGGVRVGAHVPPDDWSTWRDVRLVVPPEVCRITRTRLTVPTGSLSALLSLSVAARPARISASYRFESEDRVVLEFDGSLEHRSVRFRRVGEAGE